MSRLILPLFPHRRAGFGALPSRNQPAYLEEGSSWFAAALLICVVAGFFVPLTRASEAVAAHAGAAPAALEKCVTCHVKEGTTAPETSMAHALENVADCGILRTHPLLTFKANGYSYRIERKGNESFYSVSDGKNSITVPVGWAFGLGAAGQTYVLEKDGAFYESFVSYYRKPDALDITMGDQATHPSSLLEALGRRLGEREKAACFSCHSTNSTVQGKLAIDGLVAGVQCVRCHGDASKHLAAFKTGDMTSFAMAKLGALSTEETSTFCGQCHRTWEQIAANGPHGILNVRFQPYRLTNSRCYDVDDKRISCLGCHNPHQEIDRVSTHYDAKCQSCHGGGKAGAKSCPVGTEDCSSCHMPKVDLPGAHHQFSDHDIRIVRAKTSYPD